MEKRLNPRNTKVRTPVSGCGIRSYEGIVWWRVVGEREGQAEGEWEAGRMEGGREGGREKDGNMEFDPMGNCRGVHRLPQVFFIKRERTRVPAPGNGARQEYGGVARIAVSADYFASGFY